MSLKKKIFILFFFTATIPTLIVSIITFSIFSQKIKELENKKIDLVNGTIETILCEKIDTSNEILEYLSKTFSHKDEYLESLNIEINNENRIKHVLHHMNDISKLEKTITYIAYGSSNKEMIFDNLAKNTSLPVNYDPRTRPWYIGAINSDKTYLSELFISAITNKPVVMLSKKLEINGEILGVLVSLIDLSFLENEISKYKIGNNGSFFLVDRNKKILIDGGDNKLNFSYLSDLDLFLDDHYEIVKKTSSGLQFYHIKKLEGLDALLIGSVAEVDLNRNIIKLRYYNFVIVALTMFVILLILSILGKTFNKSLNRLFYIVENVTNGDYTKNVEKLSEIIDEKNELNILKNAIKKMNYKIIKRERELKYISEIDSLTKCYSRKAIINLIVNEINQSKELNYEFSLIMLDLDKFKYINDTFGHLFGDVVLEKMSSIILKNIKPNDYLGRYGGEEFLILLPNITLSEGVLIAERLRKLIEDTEWEYDITVTFSAGIVKYLKNETLKATLNRVDKLMYKAKKNGRNRIEY